jgi:adenylate kinase family enzyme
MKIGLVGTCTSGKTTIAELLSADGYEVRHIAQEHSYVKDMWLRITKPDYLIYLEVSYENTLQRRNLNWRRSDFEEQLTRLSHAREHADLIINTDSKSAQQVYQEIKQFLQK